MQKKHIAIKSLEEPIAKVILEDGSVHVFRLTVGAVYRMFNDDGTPAVHPQGGAAYGFEAHQMFCTVEEPNDVKLTDWREPTDKKKAN